MKLGSLSDTQIWQIRYLYKTIIRVMTKVVPTWYYQGFSYVQISVLHPTHTATASLFLMNNEGYRVLSSHNSLLYAYCCRSSLHSNLGLMNTWTICILCVISGYRKLELQLPYLLLLCAVERTAFFPPFSILLIYSTLLPFLCSFKNISFYNTMLVVLEILLLPLFIIQFPYAQENVLFLQ